jgi:hypothetical protein
MSAAVQPQPRSRSRAALWLCLGAVAASVALRALYLWQLWRIELSEPQAFVAGEAVFGIITRHIVRGARPIFYYGWLYLGAFEPYMTALLFGLLGESMRIVRFGVALSAFAWIPVTGILSWRLYGRTAGLLTASLVALPTPFVFRWGLVAFGGYSRILWMLVSLLILIRLMERTTTARLFIFGLVVGFSLWVNPLAISTVPILAAGLLLWVRPRRRQLAVVIAGAAIGMAPLVYGNVVDPLITVRALASRARSSMLLRQRIAQVIEEEHEKYFKSIPLFQILGAQPGDDGAFSVSGVATAAFLSFGALAGVWGAYRRREQDPLGLHGALLLAGCAGVSLVSGLPGFFGEPVGRYSMGLYPVLCPLAAGWIARAAPRLAVPLVGVLALGNAAPLVRVAPVQVRTPTTVVIDALLQHDLHYGFGADNMYDLVFDSAEKVIILPVEWTRIPGYDKQVFESQRQFYLYRDDQRRKISVRLFMDYMTQHGIQYDEFDVADYHVLHDFRPPGSITMQAIETVREQIRERKGRSPWQAPSDSGG